MKKRLDIWITEEGLAESRSKAQALIMAGQVTVNGQKASKAGLEIEEGSIVEIEKPFPYVSRGALKLEKAYDEFGLDFEAKVICDVGASTGGFTDFALQHGAAKSFAVDVGYGQLAHKMRQDERVVNMERTHFLEVDSLPEKIDYFVVDVSFISLKRILPQIKKIVQNQCSESFVIALVKPQFEVGKEIADRFQGVIKDSKVRNAVLDDIVKYTLSLGYEVLGKTESPIEGAKGNKEFLIYLKASF